MKIKHHGPPRCHEKIPFLTIIVLVLACISCLSCNSDMSLDTKDGIENNKELAVELREKLTKEVQKAEATVGPYNSEISNLKNELNEQQKKNRLSSYEEAISNEAINNRLQNIATNLAYLQYIQQYVNETKRAADRILTIERDLTAALRAFDVLGNKQKLGDLNQELSNFNKKYGQNKGDVIMPKFTGIPSSRIEELKKQTWQNIAPNTAAQEYQRDNMEQLRPSKKKK